MNKVFIVLYWNYGNQGTEFCGVFKTKELAKQYINKREQNEHERQWFSIYEEEVVDENF